jgi:spore coat protein CotH
MAQGVLVFRLLCSLCLLAVVGVAACMKEDKNAPAPSKAADAGATVAAPKNLDLARAALVTAKAKYAKHEVVNDADCAPLRSLEADFAQDKSPDAVKTTKEIDAFCEIDVKLEGSVATLKTDQDKLAAAQKKKDKSAVQMYEATVKDGCASIKQQLETLATDHLDGEPKVAGLKSDADRICTPPPARKN